MLIYSYYVRLSQNYDFLPNYYYCFAVCACEFICATTKSKDQNKNITLNEFTQSEKYLRLQCTVLLFVIWCVIKGFQIVVSDRLNLILQKCRKNRQSMQLTIRRWFTSSPLVNST